MNISDIRQVYLFSGIGLVILLLGVINYVNLVTAKALKKAKEIGLRKVVGAGRKQLIAFELLESICFAFLSMIMAFAITERLLNSFNQLIDKQISLHYWSREFLLFVPVFGIFLGLLAGLYPSFYISRFKPLSLIGEGSGLVKKSLVRKTLASLQFIIAGIMICVTVIMHSQMSYLRNKSLGFEKNLLVNIEMYQDIKDRSSSFKNQVSGIAGIASATITHWEYVGYTSTFRYIEKFDREAKESRNTPYVETTILAADNDLLTTMGVKILYSKPGFSLEAMDSTQIIISELFASKAGWGNDALGRYVYNYDEERHEVVAVIEDFHSTTLKEELQPTIIEKAQAWGDENLLIRLESEDHIEALDEVAKLYEQQLDRPFEYQFVNDEIDFYYRKEAAQVKLFNTFSGLAIFLSLLGLLAMTFYSVEQRRKEVSIRKVLGASVQRLILMLNKEYSILVLLAFLIASPIAYYAMQGWLEEFKYRISLSPLIFIGAFLGFLALSWLVTIAQSLKVSRENPADVLRDE